MSVKKIFKSTIAYNNFVMKNGKYLAFVQGKYVTDDAMEIKELEDEIKSGKTPFFFIDPDEAEIDTTLQDAIREAQKEAALRVIAQHNASQPLQVSGTNTSQVKDGRNISLPVAAPSAVVATQSGEGLAAGVTGAAILPKAIGEEGSSVNVGDNENKVVQVGMSAATLSSPAVLGNISNSASLAGLSAPSNSK